MNCVSHPRAVATRQCGQCQRAWCPACIKQLTVAGALLEVCAHCKGRLREPYQEPPPPSLALRELVARAFSKEGLITAAAMSAPIFLGTLFAWIPGMGWFGALMALIYYGTLVGYYFEIIAHVGDDKPGLPGPSDLPDENRALVARAVRGVVCLAMATLPYLVYVYALHDGATPRAGITALLLVAGVVYTPAIVVSIAVTHSTLGALYPVAWLKVIALSPRSYAQLVGLFLASFAAFALWALASRAIDALPLVGEYLATIVSTLLWLAQAAVVGGFLRRHAKEFGYA